MRAFNHQGVCLVALRQCGISCVNHVIDLVQRGPRDAHEAAGRMQKRQCVPSLVASGPVKRQHTCHVLYHLLQSGNSPDVPDDEECLHHED